MLPFLRDLLARPGTTRTVVMLDAGDPDAPRSYSVRPARTLAVLGIGAVLLAAAVVVTATWSRTDPDADELRAVAEASAIRADALQDSLEVQADQVALLRALITGEAPADEGGADIPTAAPTPAPSSGERAPRVAAAYAAGLRLPAPPPVDGVVSRGFDAARGHPAVDYAATVGTPVRAVAGGRVVFADWSHDGGHTIAVQHPGGYLSVYKHNDRLLKQAGDPVRAQEAVALSGDTGEVTSGPHVHVELWRDGTALDPAALLTD